MTACTDEYIQYVSAMTHADFHERIAFKFVDGGDGNMNAMEMLNHMLFHRRLSPWGGGLDDWRMRRCAAERGADGFSARPSFLRMRNHQP